MNHEKTFVYTLIFFIALFSSVSVFAKTSSPLLSIDNLGDRSTVDNGYLISSLSAQVKESQKKDKIDCRIQTKSYIQRDDPSRFHSI